MRTFLIVLLTALLTLIGGGVALQEGLIPSTLFSGQDECTSTTVVKTYEEGECEIPKSGEDCTTPWGTVAAHGDVILSFESASATLADGCTSKSSVCNDGEYINDNDPYAYEACELETPLNCEVNGFVFAHGTSEIFYEEGVLVDGEVTCNSETRACEDGEVSGGDSFEYKSCYTPGGECGDAVIVADPEPIEDEMEDEDEDPVVFNSNTTTTSTNTELLDPNRQPNCPSPFGGRRWAPGETRTLYTTDSAPFGSACESVSVTCAFGSIRYGNQDNPGAVVAEDLSNTCTVADPVPCSSACGTVSHGEQVTTYEQALIPHGNGMICADTKIVSTCSNGALSPAAGSACSCAVAPPSPCTAPNGQTIAHGGSLTLYKFPEVQALPGDGIDVCERQWRECTNGQFYDWNGNRADFEFRYASCEVLDPPEGGGPGGQGIPQEG